MITLHIRDAQGIYADSVTVDPMGPVPRRSVAIAPPMMTGTEVARWNGNGWDVLAERPHPTPEEISAIKQAVAGARWELIRVERDGERAQGGVLVSANWFHTDTDSRIKWLGLKDSARDMLIAGAEPSQLVMVDDETVPWKTMTGEFIPVTAQLALDVVEAVKVLDSKLFKRAEQHWALMLASADPGAYDYSSGWPDRFADLS